MSMPASFTLSQGKAFMDACGARYPEKKVADTEDVATLANERWCHAKMERILVRMVLLALTDSHLVRPTGEQ